MGETTFSPNSFISPPYKSCPKCGNETFGVLTIGGNSYSRRCKHCSYMVDRLPLPQLKKKIIYLDQYAVSNLMKLDNPIYQRNERLAANVFWQELRDLLAELRRLQLIVCPRSGSHVSESRISPFNAELKRTYENLSGGISFRSFDSVSSRQVGELAYAWSEGREPVFHFDVRDVLDSDPDSWRGRFYITFQDNPFVVPDEIKAARADNHGHVFNLFRNVWSKEKRSFQYWYDLERKGYQEYLRAAFFHSRRKRLESALAYRSGIELSVEDLGSILFSSAEALVSSVHQIMRFPNGGGERTPEQIDELEKSFGRANRIAEAPFVKLQSMMYAALAMRASEGQKEPPDEGMTTDIETVAYLLPYCDAMLMDNACRGLLLNIPKAMRPAEVARVYSLNTRTEFLNFLRSIRTGITREHLEALRDVYGQDACALSMQAGSSPMQILEE